jgi:predicted MFS family arabinose efflux permease
VAGIWSKIVVASRNGVEARGRATDIDYRLLVPLLLTSVIIQTVYAILRVTTSYRAIELDLPVVWLGVISATFAVLPMVLAVWLGRLLDRGHDAVAAWIGSVLLVLACAGFCFWANSITALLLLTALFGIAHLFLMASQQMLCVRCSGPRGRDAAFGNYVVSSAIGQGLGPYVVAWIGGPATLPATRPLFVIALLISTVSLVTAAAIRPAPKHMMPPPSREVVPVRTLLRQRGLMAVLVASVITITSQDLLTIYLPLLGTEQNIDVRSIGGLLTVRSIASLVSRLGYTRILRLIPRQPLTLITGDRLCLLRAAHIALRHVRRHDVPRPVARHRHDLEPHQRGRSRVRRRHGHGDVAAHYRQPARPGSGAVHRQPDCCRHRRRRHFRHHRG